MSLFTRITIPALSLTLIAGLSLPAHEDSVEVPSAPIAVLDVATGASAATAEPAPTTSEILASGIGVVGGSPELHQRAEIAAQQFLDAGLDLRGVVVVFHPTTDGCGGHDGVYRPATHHIDICNPNEFIIVHELAHAWDHANLDDDIRRRYMELRGLEAWNDSSVPWKQRGIEDLAETIVWGLGHIEDSSSGSHDIDRARAFQLIAGIELDSSTGATPDNDGRTPTMRSADEGSRPSAVAS